SGFDAVGRRGCRGRIKVRLRDGARLRFGLMLWGGGGGRRRLGDSLDVAATSKSRDFLCSDQACIGLRMTVRAVAARRWLGERVEGEQVFVDSPLEPPGQEVQL